MPLGDEVVTDACCYRGVCGQQAAGPDYRAHWVIQLVQGLIRTISAAVMICFASGSSLVQTSGDRAAKAVDGCWWAQAIRASGGCHAGCAEHLVAQGGRPSCG